MLFRILTDTRWAPAVLLFSLFGVYIALPIFVDALFLPSSYFVQLAELTAVACGAIIVGSLLPIFDHRFGPTVLRVTFRSSTFHLMVWTTFSIFLVITFVTADAIPMISALMGANADELAQQRGDFLKTRSGMEAVLIYFSTLFVSALLPYSLALQFIEKSRFRFLLLLLFLAYSLSFLQKALFINVIFPLLYLAARNSKVSTTRVITIAVSCLLLLYGVTQLAYGDADAPAAGAKFSSYNEYFGATYLPTNSLEYLVWRSTAVPMFSASDTLLVHSENFGGQPLWGATSSFFAAALGLERVPMERLVSEYQWGWSDIANTNAVYITEAYVNFGWIGALLFSLFVGQALRWFRKSEDEAFKALWLIFCFSIFNSGLIGTLLSNGYVLIFAMALFVKLKSTPRNEQY